MNTAIVTTTSATVSPFIQNLEQQKQKQQTSKEAIAANVQALIQQLEEGHSEGLTAYLTAMGRFHSYSFGNILEISRQRPDAQRVAGLYAWNQLGRKVMKGQKGIRILAPVIGIKRKKDAAVAKDEAFLQKQIATKPQLVQISTAYGQQKDGSKIITRSKYVEIKSEKPDTPEKAKWPEFKTCKYIAEAIVSEGIDKGELRKVCAQQDCPIHHPKKQNAKADSSFKAEQDKRRREEALANATGMRVLQTIAAAVPVRLMKRDLLFIAEQMLSAMEDKRLEIVARNRGIRAKEGESASKLLSAFLRKAAEGEIGKLIVEAVILLSATKQADGGKVLRAAAQAYKVDTDAIALKVKYEFAAKEKAKGEKKPQAAPKPPQKRVA